MYVGLYAICVLSWNWSLTKFYWSIEISAPIAAQHPLLASRSMHWGWSAATARRGQRQLNVVSEACVINNPRQADDFFSKGQ